MNFFVSLLFGHLVGDYLLQNNWMALNKTTKNEACIIHCLIYTISVCIFTFDFRIIWVALIFSSHFIIDSYSLAEKWLTFYKSRSLTNFLNANDNGKVIDSKFLNVTILTGSFTALVYAVADNTMHLLIMYYGHYFIKGLL